MQKIRGLVVLNFFTYLALGKNIVKILLVFTIYIYLHRFLLICLFWEDAALYGKSIDSFFTRETSGSILIHSSIVGSPIYPSICAVIKLFSGRV